MHVSHRFQEFVGALLVRILAIAVLVAFTVAPAFWIWRHFGTIAAVVGFLVLSSLYLPGWTRKWKSIDKPRLIDEHSLFGATFRCPTCGRRRHTTLPCRCGHEIRSIEWEYPGRIKSVE